MLNSWLTAIVLSLFSVLWVEVVRDIYHTLAHIFPPLYRLHLWHHRVFRPDLSVGNQQVYRQAQWYNDVPEALVMLTCSSLTIAIAAAIPLPYWGFASFGTIYTLGFLGAAMARGWGVAGADELTDATHRQGPFLTPPSHWFVNRPYHWRHHFDNQDAYFCGTLTLVDRIMGTALSLKGKSIAITGASGSLGTNLIDQLQQKGATVTALTSQTGTITLANGKNPDRTLTWEVGKENDLRPILEKIDILILNHGVNVHGDRTPAAIKQSYEINTFSSWRLLELFLTTVKSDRDRALKEVWINTSEAEVLPAISPLYELSKRTLGDLITLRRLDAPCILRKLILGPFKSNLNPIGIMSAPWVAQQIVKAATKDHRDIIVTINPITYLLFPLKEFFVSTYYRSFTR